MINNLQGELILMNSMGIKPNYAKLAEKYGMDWRTVKKYHLGYRGKPATRNKPSKLDIYKAEIADKLTIRRITIRGVYYRIAFYLMLKSLNIFKINEGQALIT